MLPRPLRAPVHRAVNAVIQRGWVRLRVAGAIAPGTAIAERFGSFGEASVMGFPYSTLYGERSIHIGRGTMLSTWVTLAAGYSPDQSSVPERALVIGDNCVIGMRSGIVAHESIEIGDDVWFGHAVFVTDANHGYQDPDVPIGKQIGPHEPVRIGAGSWVGHGSVILAGTDIGRNVVVAAGSVVRGRIPDHSVIGGVPAKVLRRYEGPEIGWVRPDGSDPRPVEPVIPEEQLTAQLKYLEEHPEELAEIEAAKAAKRAAAKDAQG